MGNTSNHSSQSYSIHACADSHQHNNPEQRQESKAQFLFKNQTFIFSNCERKKQIELKIAKSDQNHLIVKNGLNFSGRCSQSKCRANKDGFWINLGYSKFEIGKAIIGHKCPICDSRIDSFYIKSFGIMKAKATISGGKVQDNKDINFNKVVISEGDKFIFFNNEDVQVCQWNWLQVNVEKI